MKVYLLKWKDRAYFIILLRLVSVLVFYCCVINIFKMSGFKVICSGFGWVIFFFRGYLCNCSFLEFSWGGVVLGGFLDVSWFVRVVSWDFLVFFYVFFLVGWFEFFIWRW